MAEHGFRVGDRVGHRFPRQSNGGSRPRGTVIPNRLNTNLGVVWDGDPVPKFHYDERDWAALQLLPEVWTLELILRHLSEGRTDPQPSAQPAGQ